MGSSDETEPLLSPASDALLSEHESEQQATSCLHGHKKLLILVLILFGWAVIISALVVNFVVMTPAIPTPADGKEIKIFSLSVWGAPASFGTEDKEERIQAIGEYIVNHAKIDLFLLQELWMRPDHETIRAMLPRDLEMTTVGSLAPALCDGRIAPTFCSGLAVVSKFPIKEVSFTEYSAHGYIFYNVAEYWTRKGTGRVQIEM